MTFQEHKEITATDCETLAGHILSLANKVREGDLLSFEKYWIEGGTEEGDAKILAIRELIVMRYIARQDKVK